MIAPELPFNEKQRQKAVEKYKLLDTLPEESYDNITALMSYICNTPISLITLLHKDRNFLKSHFGVPIKESPRRISFCGHAINAEPLITVIEDTRKDERFFNNPLVTEQQVVFYAGAPLVDSNGFKLGTLCVYDHQPRQLSVQQMDALVILSKQVVNLFEQRLQNHELIKYQTKLKKRNENLKNFARVVSHDLKSPLSNIISLSEFLEEENKSILSEESLQYIEYLKASSNTLKQYVDGLLTFYDNDDVLLRKQEYVNTKSLLRELETITNIDSNTSINLNTKVETLFINKSALIQILVNLVTNAIKYNSKPKSVININLVETETRYKFEVEDNGNGIPEDYKTKVFELFSVVGRLDKYGNMGTGIGLATVKKIITELNGHITLTSVIDKGSVFTFVLPKK